MSFSLETVPARLRSKARELCEAIRSQALAGAYEWTMNPMQCMEEHGFTWAAQRNFCSVTVLMDEGHGEVFRIVIELPDGHERH